MMIGWIFAEVGCPGSRQSDALAGEPCIERFEFTK